MLQDKGYKILKLRKNNKCFCIRFNRLVAATRNIDFKQDLVVDHINKKKDINIPENLRSVSVSDNNKNKNPKKGKKIIAIEENGNITHYDDAKHAVKMLGSPYNVNIIRRCAVKNDKDEDGKHKVGDYIWKYLIKVEKYICKPGEHFIYLYGNFRGVELKYKNYMASNFGTFLHSEKGYAKKITDVGYPTVYFNIDEHPTSEMVHVILALLFVPGRTKEKCYVNHLNEQTGDFRLENLQWGTFVENIKYSAYKNGIPVKKICMETGKVLAVFDSRKDAANSCNVSSSTRIIKVCNGEATSGYGFLWKDIPPEELDNYPELTINKRKLLLLQSNTISNNNL